MSDPVLCPNLRQRVLVFTCSYVGNVSFKTYQRIYSTVKKYFSIMKYPSTTRLRYHFIVSCVAAICLIVVNDHILIYYSD